MRTQSEHVGNAEELSSTVAPGAVTALLREVFRSPPPPDGHAAAAFRPGRVVGRFELRREIGRGGFGIVYEARDLTLGRAVALKAVRLGRNVELKEKRLLHEAEAAAQLSHPNIVTLHDVGQFEHGPYLVMELLRGQTLGARLGRGAWPLPEALHVATEVAKAMAHAHASGVVHRDLTPGNVFLCEDGRVKVLDFGMAQAFGRRKLDGGTAPYMAPEQWEGTPEDERTDVFALGIILHQMIAGSAPFPDARALQDGTRAPALVIPDAAHVGDLVARMLSREPEARPRDGAEVVAALAAATQPPATPFRGPAPRRRAAWRIVAATIATGLVVSAISVVSERRQPGTGAATADSAPREPQLVLPALQAVAQPVRAAGPAEGGFALAAPATDAAYPGRTPAPRRSAAAPAARIHECRASIHAVATPPAATGEGVLTLDADPFGEVFVNGRSRGETPAECRVSAGTYAVRVVHPRHGAREARLVVRPGERTGWTADFLAEP